MSTPSQPPSFSSSLLSSSMPSHPMVSPLIPLAADIRVTGIDAQGNQKTMLYNPPKTAAEILMLWSGVALGCGNKVYMGGDDVPVGEYVVLIASPSLLYSLSFPKFFLVVWFELSAGVWVWVLFV